jgi:hypothetical protein
VAARGELGNPLVGDRPHLADGVGVLAVGLLGDGLLGLVEGAGDLVAVGAGVVAGHLGGIAHGLGDGVVSLAEEVLGLRRQAEVLGDEDQLVGDGRGHGGTPLEVVRDRGRTLGWCSRAEVPCCEGVNEAIAGDVPPDFLDVARATACRAGRVGVGGWGLWTADHRVSPARPRVPS